MQTLRGILFSLQQSRVKPVSSLLQKPPDSPARAMARRLAVARTAESVERCILGLAMFRLVFVMLVGSRWDGVVLLLGRGWGFMGFNMGLVTGETYGLFK